MNQSPRFARSRKIEIARRRREKNRTAPGAKTDPGSTRGSSRLGGGHQEEMKSDRRRRGVLGRALALIWWSRRLANSSKHPLNVLVQRSHDANPRKHRRPAETRDLDQSFHGSLPFRRRVIGLRQAGDVVAGIAQSHDLAPTGQQDRIIEREPRRQQASNVRSAIRLQECAERSIRILFRRTECRDLGQIAALS
jgi:hypothetical protein